MKKYIKSRIAAKMEKTNKLIKNWSLTHFTGIAVFNLILIFLFLLYSAGYFKPFVPISINLIVLIGLISSVFLLGAKAGFLFIASFIFFVFAGFLKVVGVDVWAERTTIYTYQSFVMGILLLIIQNIGIIKEE